MPELLGPEALAFPSNPFSFSPQPLACMTTMTRRKQEQENRAKCNFHPLKKSLPSPKSLACIMTMLLGHVSRYRLLHIFLALFCLNTEFSQ